jgi:hypothetical protein
MNKAHQWKECDIMRNDRINHMSLETSGTEPHISMITNSLLSRRAVQLSGKLMQSFRKTNLTIVFSGLWKWFPKDPNQHSEIFGTWADLKCSVRGICTCSNKEVQRWSSFPSWSWQVSALEYFVDVRFQTVSSIELAKGLIRMFWQSL